MKKSIVKRAGWLAAALTLVCALAGYLVTLAVILTEINEPLIPLLKIGVCFILALAVITPVSVLVSARLTSVFCRKINSIDPDAPTEAELPEEISPLISRLVKKNRDVTRASGDYERKLTEFNSIISNLDEGILLVGGTGRTVSLNGTAARVLGISEEESGSILALDLPGDVKAVVRSALAGNDSECYLSYGERHYAVISSPVTKGNTTDGAVLFIIDDTEKEERYALRSEFTSNVSHELKTPLTSISGFAELIKEGMATGEDAKNCAKHIYKECSRLIRLVDDIIDLSRVDSGEISFDKEPCEIASVIEEVVESLGSVAKRNGIEISASIETRGEISGNRHVLDDMIYNLLDNAIKYNRQGGMAAISLTDGVGAFILTVKDTGIGIPEDQRDRVFERFYRIDKSHSKEIGGTGLGLAIVKHGVLFHGASISLKSKLGEGTQITVSFPKNL